MNLVNAKAKLLISGVLAFLFLLAGYARAQTVTTTVAAGTSPVSVAVNPVTNKIYVANLTSGNVTVIDGATNTTGGVASGQRRRRARVERAERGRRCARGEGARRRAVAVRPLRGCGR